MPPSPDNIDSSLEETNGEEPSKLIAEAASKFEFTKVECLLFIFHTVGKQAPEFLADNPEVLKELKVRAQNISLIKEKLKTLSEK